MKVNIKENIYAVTLFIIEVALFALCSRWFGIPKYLLIRIGAVWFFVGFMFKHYSVGSTLIWDEINAMIKVLATTIIIGLILMYPSMKYILQVICINIIMFIISILINRGLRIILRDVLAKKTMIVGTSYGAYRLGKIAHNNRFALTKIVGFFSLEGKEICEEMINEQKFQATIYDFKDVDTVLKEEKIDQVIIAIDDGSKEDYDMISRDLFDKVPYIKVKSDLNFIMTYKSKVDYFDGELLISTSRGNLGHIQRFFKRFVDICVGVVGCLTLLPLTLYVTIMNKKNGDNDPVLFKQERIGMHGKPIYIYKYRSMIPNAEQVLEELMEKDPSIKEEYLTNKKLVNDPRITPVGKFLRRTSLDEFPQFINVLKGDMSFIGPRPYLPREKEDMDIYYDSIIACKPGITGMWQANGRSGVGFKDRCKLDDFYHKNWTFGLDLIIIYKTIKSVIYGKGAL
ncbi:MAG: exopolysaccharide biosynthesis polyprenyl glycosylphosphotransferase [Erysipelotrichaceae bacterium]|nr:exopolysaccharide biosynthesis polyprenyl glycosylphosphotransferase [Erysipelotrichaceae bacterium]